MPSALPEDIQSISPIAIERGVDQEVHATADQEVGATL